MYNFRTLWGMVFNSCPYLVNRAKEKIMRGQIPFGTPLLEELYENLKDDSIKTNNPKEYVNKKGASEFLFEQIKLLDKLEREHDIRIRLQCRKKSKLFV